MNGPQQSKKEWKENTLNSKIPPSIFLKINMLAFCTKMSKAVVVNSNAHKSYARI